MDKREVRERWRKYAQKYYWGDDLDVRYFLCGKLSELRGKKIIDLGCNCGVLDSCIDGSNEVLGVDINDEMLAIARSLNPGFKFSNADMFSLGASLGAQFDVVLASHVFPKNDYASSHEPSDLLDVAWKLLKPGGTLFLTTPNAENGYYRNKKILTYEKLDAMMRTKAWKYEIFPWNPLSIYVQKLHAPGSFALLEWLSQKKVGMRGAVSFFIVARKPG